MQHMNIRGFHVLLLERQVYCIDQDHPLGLRYQNAKRRLKEVQAQHSRIEIDELGLVEVFVLLDAIMIIFKANVEKLCLPTADK